MDIIELIEQFNIAIIQLRGVYSQWSKVYGISYNETLVIYTLRSQGYCIQKEISDRYLIPRQTIHNVIKQMMNNALLKTDKEKNVGRQKAYVLTEKGKQELQPLMDSLTQYEIDAANQIGITQFKEMNQMLLTYHKALVTELKEVQRNGTNR